MWSGGLWGRTGEHSGENLGTCPGVYWMGRGGGGQADGGGTLPQRRRDRLAALGNWPRHAPVTALAPAGRQRLTETRALTDSSPPPPVAPNGGFGVTQPISGI